MSKYLNTMVSTFMLMTLPGLNSCVKQEIVQADKKIVMLGDSLIAYNSDWGTDLGMSDVTSYGYAGYTAGAILGAPLTNTLNDNPELVYIMLGANDCLNGVDVNTTMANFTSLCDQLKAANIPFVITLPPRLSYSLGSVHVYQDRVETLISELTTFCVSNGYRYMDLRPWLCYTHSDGEFYMKDEYTTDGLHFSSAGYEEWVTYLTYDINQH